MTPCNRNAVSKARTLPILHRRSVATIRVPKGTLEDIK